MISKTLALKRYKIELSIHKDLIVEGESLDDVMRKFVKEIQSLIPKSIPVQGKTKGKSVYSVEREDELTSCHWKKLISYDDPKKAEKLLKTKNSYNLQKIINQTQEMCIAAVKNNADAVIHIKEEIYEKYPDTVDKIVHAVENWGTIVIARRISSKLQLRHWLELVAKNSEYHDVIMKNCPNEEWKMEVNEERRILGRSF